MRDLFARVVWALRWHFASPPHLRSPVATTWRASGAYIEMMRSARFRRLL